jgi:hypothetical protein
MTHIYTLKINWSNGYRCSCCAHSWTEEETISIDIPDSVNLKKKSAHDLTLIKNEIWELLKKQVDSENHGDEVVGYSLSYEYWNDDVEASVVFDWDEPFNLDKELVDYRQKRVKEKEANERAAEIARLKRELKELQKDV